MRRGRLAAVVLGALLVAALLAALGAPSLGGQPTTVPDPDEGTTCPSSRADGMTADAAAGEGVLLAMRKPVVNRDERAGPVVTIRVLVADRAGAAIAGALVRVTNGELGVVMEATTGESGRVTLSPSTNAEAAPWLVDAFAAGFADAREEVILDAANPIARVALRLERAVLVSGRVVDAHGKPVVGVSLRDDSRIVDDLPRVTGDGGEFTAFFVRVIHDDAGPAAKVVVDSPIGHAESTRIAIAPESREVCVDLVWPKDGSWTREVKGHVERPDGSPAAGAVVAYRPRYSGSESGPGPGSGRARCDSHGEFSLLAPAYFSGCTGSSGDGSLVATLPGFGAAIAWLPIPNVPFANRGFQPATVDLRLHAAREITGRVVGIDGRGVRGARVELCGAPRGEVVHRRPGAAAKGTLWGDEEPWRDVIAVVWADDGGRYGFDDAPDRLDLVLRAWSDGTPQHLGTPGFWHEFWRAWLPLPASRDSVEIGLPMDVSSSSSAPAPTPEDAVISLRLVDSAGRPVHPTLSAVECRIGEDTTTVDATVVGNVVELRDAPRGHVRLRLASDDLSPIEATIDSTESATPPPLRVVVPDRASVRARLAVPPGLVDEDIELTLVSVADEDVVRALRRSPDGSRIARGVAPGRWRVVADVLGDGWEVSSPSEIVVADVEARTMDVSLAPVKND